MREDLRPRRTGGIQGALAATADRVMLGLTETGMAEDARRLLLRLVRLGEGTQDTRRRVIRSRLIAELPDPGRTAAVLTAFAADEARLITLGTGGGTGEAADTVEIAHEALLSAWPTMRAWIEADRAGLLVEQHLIEASHTWDAEGRDDALLCRGARLTLAADWTGRGGERLGPLAREFLAASVRHEQAAQRAARRRARVRVAISGVLAVALVIALGATVVALRAQQDALTQQRSAVARGMTLKAETLHARDPATALRLGAAAVAVDANPDARNGLLATLAANHYRGTLVNTPCKSVWGIMVSGDGRLAIVTPVDTAPHLWDISRPAAPRRPALLPDGACGLVALSADGRTALTIDAGQNVASTSSSKTPS